MTYKKNLAICRRSNRAGDYVGLDMIETLVQLGFTPLNIVLIAMLYAMGVRQGLFPKIWGNGRNGNGSNERFDQIDQKLETLGENHISHLEMKLDKVMEQNAEQYNETKSCLQNIKHELSKINEFGVKLLK